MSLERYTEVAKNTGWLLFANVFSRVLTAVFIILLANYLLPGDFGVYNFAFSLGFIFSVIPEFGLDALCVRRVSRDESKGAMLLSNILGMRIVLGVATLGVLALTFFGFLRFYQPGLTLWVLLTVGAVLVLERVSGSFFALFRARGKMELQSLVMVVWKILYVGLGVLAIILGRDLLFILSMLLIASLVRLFVALSIYETSLEGTLKTPRFSLWKDIFKGAKPFALFTFLNMVYGHIVIVLIALLAGSYSTGLYSASWKVIVFLGVVPHSFGRALYPLFSKLFTSEKKALKKTYKHSLRYLLSLSLPLSLGLFVIGGRILSFIYSEEYSSTIRVFKTLVWMLPFLFMNGSLNMVLWSSERTLDSSKNLFYATVSLAVLGVLFIPFYGIVGAALAVVFAEVVRFTANYWLVQGEHGSISLSTVWKPLLSSVVMALILFIPRFLGDGLGILASFLLIGIAVYFAVLYLIGGIKNYDVKMLKGVLLKRKEN